MLSLSKFYSLYRFDRPAPEPLSKVTATTTNAARKMSKEEVLSLLPGAIWSKAALDLLAKMTKEEEPKQVLEL